MTLTLIYSRMDNIRNKDKDQEKKKKPWMNPGARECRLANPERDYLNTKHTPRENLMVHPLQKRCLQKTTYPYCDTKMSAYRFVNTTF